MQPRARVSGEIADTLANEIRRLSQDLREPGVSSSAEIPRSSRDPSAREEGSDDSSTDSDVAALLETRREAIALRTTSVIRGQDQKAKEWEVVQRAYTGVADSDTRGTHWVEGDEFKSVIGVLIVLNTLLMGLEIEFCRDPNSPDCQVRLLWLAFAWFFTFAWATEMVLR